MFPCQFRHETRPGTPRNAQREPVKVTGLLIENSENSDKEDQKQEGLVVTLQLEAVTMLEGQPTGQLYPHPELVLVRRDDVFDTSEKNASNFLRGQNLWPQGYDVRWRLQRRDEKPIPALAGPSMGLTFAMGMGKLLASL